MPTPGAPQLSPVQIINLTVELQFLPVEWGLAVIFSCLEMMRSPHKTCPSLTSRGAPPYLHCVHYPTTRLRLIPHEWAWCLTSVSRRPLQLQTDLEHHHHQITLSSSKSFQCQRSVVLFFECCHCRMVLIKILMMNRHLWNCFYKLDCLWKEEIVYNKFQKSIFWINNDAFRKNIVMLYIPRSDVRKLEMDF